MIDPAWEERYRKGYGTDCPSEDVAMFLASLEPKTLLDVGCGTGANMFWASRRGIVVTGIDGSKSALRSAVGRLKGSHHHLDLVEMPLTLKYPKCHFDVALDIECLYCLPLEEARAMYNEIHRVLRKGGKLMVKAFAEGSWKGKEVIPNARFSTREQMTDLLSMFTIERTYILARTTMKTPRFLNG